MSDAKSIRDSKIKQLLEKISDAKFDLDAFMNLAVNEVLALTPATGAVVELVEENEMVYRATTGTMTQSLGLRLPKIGSISGLCVETHQILISNDTEKDDRVNLEACRRVKARSLVVVPLFHVQKAVGVLKIISDQPDAFTQDDVETLEMVASCLGSALGNQIYQEIRNFF